GANPQAVAVADMCPALEKGVIACDWMSHDVAISSKIHEVAPYAIDLNLGAVALAQLLVNRELFEGFPENVRKLMLSAAEQASAEEVVYLAEIFEKTIKEDMPANKMEYIHFEDTDKFAAVEPNMPELWEKDMAAAGLADAGKQVGDILRAARSKLVK